MELYTILSQFKRKYKEVVTGQWEEVYILFCEVKIVFFCKPALKSLFILTGFDITFTLRVIYKY
jgi:hypothetical protein